jgi:cysteine desulfurase/selenocysteine lyase
LQLQKRTGIVIEIIPEKDYYEELDLDALRKMLEQSSSAFSQRVVLVSLNHVPTSSGKVYNVEGVGALTKEFKVPFLVDACQSVGQMPVDVQKINCDFLTGTGRKYLRAPRGSGFLYCSKDAMQYFEPATLDNTGATWTSADTYELRPTARRFERYEMSFAAKVGLGIAVEQCLELGIDRIWHRIQYLARELHIRVEDVKVQVGRRPTTVKKRGQRHQVPRRSLSTPSPFIYRTLAHTYEPRLCSHGQELCGIVTFTVDDITADELQKELAEAKINTSVSRISSSRLYFEKEELKAVVRASVHYYNTEEEINTFVEVVDRIAKQRYEASKPTG